MYWYYLDKKPPNEWPVSGKIVFKNFNLRYNPNGPYILKNLNIEIEPMEKVNSNIPKIYF